MSWLYAGFSVAYPIIGMFFSMAAERYAYMNMTLFVSMVFLVMAYKTK
ncbi:hypothetical protein Arno162_55 [Pectobacterium phage Arno162]|uniref:Uncharacterized protein n=2 Tax=Arnovirus TaxID=3425109 RepID=A0A678ZRR3_9CAUD|nr:hypothetical protein Arno162_55 [Pectobacterium phage Arno162]AZV02242.1 hypothetical protein Arno18_56 [Pectobacterium phage Arno18]